MKSISEKHAWHREVLADSAPSPAGSGPSSPPARASSAAGATFCGCWTTGSTRTKKIYQVNTKLKFQTTPVKTSYAKSARMRTIFFRSNIFQEPKDTNFASVFDQTIMRKSYGRMDEILTHKLRSYDDAKNQKTRTPLLQNLPRKQIK
jgi:hypothetical protein